MYVVYIGWIQKHASLGTVSRRSVCCVRTSIKATHATKTRRQPSY